MQPIPADTVAIPANPARIGKAIGDRKTLKTLFERLKKPSAASEPRETQR